MQRIQLPRPYEEYLRRNLNLVERFRQAFSGTDERLDYTNMLLTLILTQLGGISPVVVIPGTPTPTPTPTLPSISTLANRSSFITGQKTVTNAGTAEQITTSDIFIPDGFAVTIIAKPGNSGYIYLGSSKSDAEGASQFNGLDAGLAVSLRIKNLKEVWVDAQTSGDGISWLMER